MILAALATAFALSSIPPSTEDLARCEQPGQCEAIVIGQDDQGYNEVAPESTDDHDMTIAIATEDEVAILEDKVEDLQSAVAQLQDRLDRMEHPAVYQGPVWTCMPSGCTMTNVQTEPVMGQCVEDTQGDRWCSGPIEVSGAPK